MRATVVVVLGAALLAGLVAVPAGAEVCDRDDPRCLAEHAACLAATVVGEAIGEEVYCTATAGAAHACDPPYDEICTLPSRLCQILADILTQLTGRQWACVEQAR